MDVVAKQLVFIGSARKDIQAFPEDVRWVMGVALREAQLGRKSDRAKPLKGFCGASVLEILDDYDRDAYRTVYTLEFPKVVYVLHAFQKKSKSGIATPKSDINLIKSRLKAAKADYEDKGKSLR
ncbi:MAG: type II toxin-antitoxin system RelE/ParE family toxin [Coriobacteriia bacterium]